jgi:hypothetical protein
MTLNPIPLGEDRLREETPAVLPHGTIRRGGRPSNGGEPEPALPMLGRPCSGRTLYIARWRRLRLAIRLTLAIL